MAHTRSDGSTSEYYAHGWDRVGEKELWFTAVAALSSYPMESFLGEVLSDDRVGRKAEELHNLVSGEVGYLDQLPSGVWVRLGDLLGISSPYRLQHAVMSACHISFAYLCHRCLHTALGYPWRLCRGDIRANLQALGQMYLGDDTDETTKLVQGLVRAGSSELELVDAISLLGECGWSTKGVEEQHGSIATVHKYHRELEAASLAARSFVHTCRPLFRPDADSKTGRRLAQACKQLSENRGRAVSAFNMFYARMTTHVQPAMQRQGHNSVQKHILKLSHKKWNQMSPSQKQRYFVLAAKETEQRRQDLAEDRLHAEAQFELHHSRTGSQLAESRSRNMLSAVRFGDADLKRIDESLASSLFSKSVVDDWNHRSGQAPHDLKPGEAVALRRFMEEPPQRQVPSWAKVVCYHRDQLCDTIFRSTQRCHRDVAFLFLFATQQPFHAFFSALGPAALSGHPSPLAGVPAGRWQG